MRLYRSTRDGAQNLQPRIPELFANLSQGRNDPCGCVVVMARSAQRPGRHGELLSQAPNSGLQLLVTRLQAKMI